MTAPVQSTVQTFRDTIKRASPPWLRRGLGERILYAIGLHLDILGDAAVAAVKCRFPGVYSDESQAVIGRERRIRRGIGETNAIYSTRLIRWLDDHAHRGGPYAMLAQLYAHYATAPFAITLINRVGNAYAMATDGTVARSVIAWNPDTEPLRWARWWLIYALPAGAFASDGTWGDAGTWGDGGVWGSTLTPAEVLYYRLIPAEWNAAHTTGTIVLNAGTAELWGYPVGTWGDPGVWGGGFSTQISVR